MGRAYQCISCKAVLAVQKRGVQWLSCLWLWPMGERRDRASWLSLQVDNMLKAYAAKFQTIKAPRKLQWRPHLGSVDLKVTVGARTLELNVSPTHAAILHQFKVGEACMPFSLVAS